MPQKQKQKALSLPSSVPGNRPNKSWRISSPYAYEFEAMVHDTVINIANNGSECEDAVVVTELMKPVVGEGLGEVSGPAHT
jgi:hypothetical protein